MMMNSDKRMSLDGVEINYLDNEREGSEVILFIHGWGMQASAYKSGLKKLGLSFRVVALDLPGFGESKILSFSEKKCTSFDYAKFIDLFYKELGIDKFYLVGHSMGGGISSLIAALFPEKVLKLIIIDSTGKPLGNFRKVLISRLLEIPLQTISYPLPKENFYMGRAFLNNIFKNGSHTLEALSIPLKENLMSYFKMINMPCLVLWGEDDKTIPLEVGKEIATLIPNSKFIEIEGGYHEWSIVMPDRFSKLVTDFIRA